MNYTEILERLESLDLKSYPKDKIKELLTGLGKVGVIITSLYDGKRILRARINEDKKQFKSLSELSFKPQEFNTTYQRASTPQSTMFYGSIVPEILGKTEPDTARITTLYELSEFVRAIDTIGTQKITFSVWEVCSDVELLSLVHYKNFQRPTELSKKLQNDYDKFISHYPQFKQSSFEITQFLGEQFAKPVNSIDDYNYMISAIYSEMLIGFGFDGVLYPSVKLAGEGINIAVKPEIIGDKIKFIHAGECTVYKNKKQVFVGNDTYANVEKDGNLKFEKAPAEVYTSEEFGLKYVGLK
ncbi:MAG: hypothetical protein HOO86_13620 [Bacteroidales bacterium]|nr:hypothetical protein [Bacteroidales bacterium]